MFEQIVFILLLVSTLLTQIKIPYINLGVHNVLIPAFSLTILGMRKDALKDAVICHRKTLIFMALLYTWMWISALVSAHQETAVKYSVKYTLYPVMLAAFLVLTYRNERISNYYRLIIYFLLMLSFFGVLEEISPLLSIFKIIKSDYTCFPRISSLMQNPNPFGLLMSMGIILAIILRNDGTISGIECIVNCILFILTTLLSGSRNAVITFLFGFILLFAYREIRLGRRSVNWFAAIVGCILIIIFMSFLVSENKMTYIANNITGHLVQSEGSTRLLLMKRSMLEFAQQPFTGIGVEVFSTYIGPQVISGSIGYHTHNIITNILVELGMVGLLLAVSIFCSLLKGVNWRDTITVIPILMIITSQMSDYFFHDYTFPAVAFFLLALAANSKINDNIEKPSVAI